MDLFFPRGVADGEVADPRAIGAEMLQAYALSMALSAFQFNDGVIPNTTYLSGQVRFLKAGGAAYITSLFGFDPAFTDPELWMVPYNRGYSTVGSGKTNELTLTWSSEYPELLLPIMSLQFVTRRHDDAVWAAFWVGNDDVRAQIRMRLDGAVLQGSGPWGAAQDGKYRGTGLSEQGTPVAAFAPWMVPAGTHTLEVVAAQNCAEGSTDDAEVPAAFSETPPNDSVWIGNRFLYLLAFARGRELTP